MQTNTNNQLADADQRRMLVVRYLRHAFGVDLNLEGLHPQTVARLFNLGFVERRNDGDSDAYASIRNAISEQSGNGGELGFGPLVCLSDENTFAEVGELLLVGGSTQRSILYTYIAAASHSLNLGYWLDEVMEKFEQAVSNDLPEADGVALELSERLDKNPYWILAGLRQAVRIGSTEQTLKYLDAAFRVDNYFDYFNTRSVKLSGVIDTRAVSGASEQDAPGDKYLRDCLAAPFGENNGLISYVNRLAREGNPSMIGAQLVELVQPAGPVGAFHYWHAVHEVDGVFSDTERSESWRELLGKLDFTGTAKKSTSQLYYSVFRYLLYCIESSGTAIRQDWMVLESSRWASELVSCIEGQESFGQVVADYVSTHIDSARFRSALTTSGDAAETELRGSLDRYGDIWAPAVFTLLQRNPNWAESIPDDLREDVFRFLRSMFCRFHAQRSNCRSNTFLVPTIGDAQKSVVVTFDMPELKAWLESWEELCRKYEESSEAISAVMNLTKVDDVERMVAISMLSSHFQQGTISEQDGMEMLASEECGKILGSIEITYLEVLFTGVAEWATRRGDDGIKFGVVNLLNDIRAAADEEDTRQWSLLFIALCCVRWAILSPVERALCEGDPIEARTHSNVLRNVLRHLRSGAPHWVSARIRGVLAVLS